MNQLYVSLLHLFSELLLDVIHRLKYFTFLNLETRIGHVQIPEVLALRIIRNIHVAADYGDLALLGCAELLFLDLVPGLLLGSQIFGQCNQV